RNPSLCTDLAVPALLEVCSGLLEECRFANAGVFPGGLQLAALEEGLSCLLLVAKDRQRSVRRRLFEHLVLHLLCSFCELLRGATAPPAMIGESSPAAPSRPAQPARYRLPSARARDPSCDSTSGRPKSAPRGKPSQRLPTARTPSAAEPSAHADAR